MEFAPAFEIGVWNAWLFVAYFMAHPLIMKLLDPAHADEKMAADEDLEFTRGERAVLWAGSVCAVVGAVYSIGLPLKLGTAWWYVGGPIAVAGFAIFTLAMVDIARTPVGRPFTTGLYRISRHPMNVSCGVGFAGVGVATGSWLFLALGLAFAASLFAMNGAEERACLARYGDAYRAYRDRTPKYLGVPRRPASPGRTPT